jgi:hypothetical protein
MKKFVVLFFLISAVLMFGNSAKAQFDYFGGGIAIATGGEYEYDGLPYYNNSFGIDLRASYNYNKKLKIVPDFKIYLPNTEPYPSGGESKTTVYVFNLNAHYILNPRTRNNYHLYLLAGAHIGAWNIKDNHDEITRIVDIKTFKFAPGANAGAGMQFVIGNKTLFFAEVKYVIAKTNQMVFTPGLLYSF